MENILRDKSGRFIKGFREKLSEKHRVNISNAKSCHNLTKTGRKIL